MRYRKDDYRSALQVYAEARKVMIAEIRRHRASDKRLRAIFGQPRSSVRDTSGGATVTWRRLVLTKQKPNRIGYL